MEEYRSGLGSLFVYSNDELRHALERHAHLTRHLWPGAFVILRKTSWGEFEAELRLRDVGPVQHVDAPSLRTLLEIVLPIIEAAAPDGWVAGD
jgi:hypothetical protein